MYGDPELWHDAAATGSPTIAGAFLRVQVEAGASARSSCSTRGSARCRRRTTRATCCRTRATVLDGVADLGVPRIHFGVGTGELLGAMGEAGRRRRRRRLAGRRSTRPSGGSGPARRCRATSTPPSLFAPVGRSSRRRSRDVLAEGAGRAGPRLQPRPRRAARDRPRRPDPRRRAGARAARREACCRAHDTRCLPAVTARVAVIGGGVAGLAAAVALAGRAEVTVLEASARVGREAEHRAARCRRRGRVVPCPSPGRRSAAAAAAGVELTATRTPLGLDLAREGPAPAADRDAAGGPDRSPRRRGDARVRGTARAALDRVLPRRGSGDDPAVGAYIRARLGERWSTGSSIRCSAVCTPAAPTGCRSVPRSRSSFPRWGSGPCSRPRIGSGRHRTRRRGRSFAVHRWPGWGASRQHWRRHSGAQLVLGEPVRALARDGHRWRGDGELLRRGRRCRAGRSRRLGCWASWDSRRLRWPTPRSRWPPSSSRPAPCSRPAAVCSCRRRAAGR